MAVYKIPYPGLNESLKHLRIQVIHSLPYAVRNCPKNLKSPEAVFNYCKSKFIYKSDPVGVELFQTVPTLLTNNELGTPGAGDCDDATIFVLTILLINGFTDCGIVLAGRSGINATHIYNYCTENGQRKILDLTTNKFNKEGGKGNYTNRQFIPFKISQNQLNMFLQLADGPTKKRLRFRKLNPQQKEQAVYMPSKNVFIPIDKFDKLPIPHASQTLLSEGYDLEQLSEYLSGRKERKARKAEKKAFKTEKRKAKIEKKRAKVDIKKAKAQKKRDQGTAKKIKAQAKVIKAKKGPSGQGMKIFDKVSNVAKDFINRKQEGEEEEIENPFAPEAVEGEEQDYYNPEEANEYEPDTENVESEETDESAEPTELEEGFPALGKEDLITGGLFLLGCFLEKTKKVA